MHELTKLIQQEMAPALGVTEPGAIAFCAAKARELIGGELIRLDVFLNSGMYKNALTCGIPNSEMTGAACAAALGFAAGKAEKGLLALEDVTPEDCLLAKRYVDENRISVTLDGITSRIGIRAHLTTDAGVSEVVIRDSHTNVTRIAVNGRVILDKSGDRENHAGRQEETGIHRHTLEKLVDYAKTVPADEISFIRKAYDVNLALVDAALQDRRMVFAPHLFRMNGGRIVSEDEKRTALLLAGAAIEARVGGVNCPAMSITGSGAHGIIATLPLYAAVRVSHFSEEILLRATALSYLVCMYIKEYSGRLSALCGCAVAAGTGMAAALCFLKGGDTAAAGRAINNMAASITGMVCDGGNQGCVMKAVSACETAFDSAQFALAGIQVDGIHGICGLTPEDTMRNIGLIASPGMTATEKTILEIQQGKTGEAVSAPSG